jgi:hypothetical protein
VGIICYDAGHAQDGDYQLTSSFREVVLELFKHLRPRLSHIRLDNGEGRMNSNIEGNRARGSPNLDISLPTVVYIHTRIESRDLEKKNIYESGKEIAICA